MECKFFVVASTEDESTMTSVELGRREGDGGMVDLMMCRMRQQTRMVVYVFRSLVWQMGIVVVDWSQGIRRRCRGQISNTINDRMSDQKELE